MNITVHGERKTALKTIIAGRPVVLCLREWRIAKPRGQVICLHGLGVTGAEYAPMAASLNSAGFDVLAPDWIGHGDSEYLGDPKAYDWNSYIKCLATVFHHRHTPVTHYVGASFGAKMLMLFLLSQKILPRSSTFVDIALRASPFLAKSLNVVSELGGRKFATLAEAKAFLQARRSAFAQAPEGFRDYLDGERYHRQDEGITFKFDPAILPSLASSISSNFDYVGALKRIRFKSLFLYGAKSPYRMPTEFMILCAQAPHIRYRDDLPAGHPPTLLEEEQFAYIVDFIKQANLSPMR